MEQGRPGLDRHGRDDAAGDGQGWSWSSDLDDIADLAAELAPPEDAEAARLRRATYVGPRAVPRRGAPSRRRRLWAAAVAACLLWTVAVSAALLRHGPRPVTTSTVYSTPRPAPTAGDPSPSADGVVPNLGSLPPLASSAAIPGPPQTLRPAPTPAPAGVITSPPVLSPPASHPAPPPPPPAPRATSAPTRAPAPPPTRAPAPPPAAPDPTFAVTAASLEPGTCHSSGSTWICPFTATFTLRPGAEGTLSWEVAGTVVDCYGTSAPFTSAMPSTHIPRGVTQATETGYMVFPAGQHPAAFGDGSRPSTAATRVTGPNPVSSPERAFQGDSCP
jgi:hypothetical protein